MSPSDDDASDDEELSTASGSGSSSSLDVEEAYERTRATKKVAFEDKPQGTEKLPVKLSDGKVQKRGFVAAPQPEEESDSEEEAVSAPPLPEPAREDVSTGARFGRPAVVSVISNKSRKARIQGAKEQLASICQEIIADPENSVCLVSETQLPELF